MFISGVRWRLAIAAAVVAQVVLVAATVLWVAVYSYAVNPGQPVAVYHGHARFAGPWISILAGVVVFYAIGRWWIRSPATAAAWVAIYVAADTAILWAVWDADTALAWPMIAASYSTKVICGLLGARHGARGEEARHA